MPNSFFEKVAHRVLYLEINTIVKSDMDGTKMPSSKRRALYELARDYHKKLVELKVRDPIYWEYGGIRSFEELWKRAQEGIQTYESRQEAFPEKREEIQQKIKTLERIQFQSTRIVDMFKILEGKIKDRKGPGCSPAPKSEEVKSHEESEAWNNDIDRNRINIIDDLDLSPDQITLLQKAWDIGTEPILLQTIIQIDGDVTTRMSESFAKKPNDTILGIHNQSIVTATTFWSNLVKLITEVVGKTFEWVLGRR